MAGNGFLSLQVTVAVDIQSYRSDLQQGVLLWIEAGGFDVDYNGQEATKAFRNYGCRIGA